jgi:hypothetical protein
LRGVCGWVRWSGNVHEEVTAAVRDYVARVA